MRLLANENFPALAVEALRARGHDIAWIRTEAPGISDREVIQRATDEDRTLLTFDKDFGELVFRVGVPTSSGVVLFRVTPSSPESIAQTAIAVLESRADWGGHFSVIEEARIRMIPLP